MVLQAKEDCLKNGTLIPDEAAFIDTVRENCLGRGAPAPDIETVKDFFRFYIATSWGILNHRSTVDSVNTYAEWFFAGFTRVTETLTNKKERSEVFNVGVSYVQVKGWRLISLLTVGPENAN